MIALYCTGCPRVVRADYGTENCMVARLQIAFRMHHYDDLNVLNDNLEFKNNSRAFAKFRTDREYKKSSPRP